MKFSTFRIIFGSYLTWHFFWLIPFADELFGSAMPYDPCLNPTYDTFPNMLNIVDATYFLVALMSVAALFASGYLTSLCSMCLAYGWACLMNRNIFIANPGMPYIGWILFACMIIPFSRSGVKWMRDDEIPKGVLWIGWFLMAFGYTASGLHKLQCPSWIDGSALQHVLEGPLARDNFIRDMLVSLPPIVLKIMTWGSLAFEISYLPFGVFFHTRFWYWAVSILFHIGIVMTINFTDLTLGMIMIHLFTMEDRWISYLDYFNWLRKIKKE